ncbi:MAG TPA: hypothetical protein PLD20_09860 [Blastocatellia bacterium]|nr:hypothetical protein [Blastocatellia bacterium]HMV82017.1 hypothetical protein [Blastocatellia bacterium]HMX26238.1 hypothetical protein [Blastocatellia bacterium]HMY70543.1 hypothetical protein [Blastocatellia bacterium]HMZ18225.1 hypothetical protein [Blastocatellia bacterium]
MIPHLRESFNAKFTEEKYRRLLDALNQAVGVNIEFRPCETPVFLPTDLLTEMQQAGKELIAQLCTPDYLAASARAVPADYNAPNEGARPDFIQVDFAVTRDAEGRFAPKLIELQGCASLYAFQYLMPQEYQRVYDLGDLNCRLSGLTDEGYLESLRRVFLNGHTPEQTVLMEITPLHQKTLPDFTATEKLFGIPYVDVSEIIKRGNKLFYLREGREIEIRRIYNRVIIDEFVRKGVKANFDFRDELDVEWAGHPNWYFRMSKFSLPFLNHPTVPRAWFLNQLDEYPNDLENFVLKPLFSFAGSGVKVSITREDLDAVPANERGDFLLQEKVVYAPVIETMDEPSKVEIRVMFVWPEDAAEPVAVTTLARLSKGAMMGVDFNKNKTWVGSSCSFFEA